MNLCSNHLLPSVSVFKKPLAAKHVCADVGTVKKSGSEVFDLGNVQ